MESIELKSKINNLKHVLKEFSSDAQMVGVAIFRKGSSENWLFNTEVDISEIVPIVTKALEKEIAELEAELPAIEQAEAEQKAIEEQQAAIAEAERIAQYQIEQEAAKQAEWEALILKQKQILLAQEEARKLIESEKMISVESVEK